MANDIEPPGTLAEIGVSKLYLGEVRLELASSSGYIATHPELKYPCFHFTLKGGDDLYLAASSISFMKLTDGALYLNHENTSCSKDCRVSGKGLHRSKGERFWNAGIDCNKKQLLSPRSSDAPFIEKLNRKIFNNILSDVSRSFPRAEQDEVSRQKLSSQKRGEMPVLPQPVLKASHASVPSSLQNSESADKQTNGHHGPRILEAPMAKKAISPKEAPSTLATSAQTPQPTARPAPREVVMAGQAEPKHTDVLCRFPDTIDGVALQNRLPYCEMLNDNNIELGMKYILFNEHYKEFQQSCYVFNTYFFTKISNAYNSKKFRNAEKRFKWSQTNYAEMKRWTRKVDIFEQEHIVIPINDEVHWCILIIKNPKALLRHQDDPNPPTVHQLVQKNYVDCGVYLLAFFEQYVSKLPIITEDLVLDWIDYSPFFEVTMLKYYREKLVKFIKSQAGPTRWSLLERYERRHGGVTNPSCQSRAAAARKTRNHSFCEADWVQQCMELQNRRNRRQRAHSAPIRYDILLSTKPLVITRENGVAQGRIN